MHEITQHFIIDYVSQNFFWTTKKVLFQKIFSKDCEESLLAFKVYVVSEGDIWQVLILKKKSSDKCGL